jgi:hypothetical protein
MRESASVMISIRSITRAARGADVVYVFACDHPDARNARINVMFEFTPTGERIRRTAIRQ